MYYKLKTTTTTASSPIPIHLPTMLSNSPPSSSSSPPSHSPTPFPSPSQGSPAPAPPSPPPPVVVSPCAACKILRRRCVEKCVLAPYFPPTDPLKFTIAHRVFGASNIIKFLQVPYTPGIHQSLLLVFDFFILCCVVFDKSTLHGMPFFLEDNTELAKLSLVISEKQNHGFWSKVGGKASGGIPN